MPEERIKAELERNIVDLQIGITKLSNEQEEKYIHELIRLWKNNIEGNFSLQLENVDTEIVSILESFNDAIWRGATETADQILEAVTNGIQFIQNEKTCDPGFAYRYFERMKKLCKKLNDCEVQRKKIEDRLSDYRQKYKFNAMERAVVVRGLKKFCKDAEVIRQKNDRIWEAVENCIQDVQTMERLEKAEKILLDRVPTMKEMEEVLRASGELEEPINLSGFEIID